MEPFKFEKATHILNAPKNWDVVSHGKCVGLPICRDDNDFVYSCWKPTWRERIKLLFGHPVKLVIASYNMPPVALEVGEP